MVGRATGHRPHLEDLQLDAFATQNRPGLIPIHLRFRAPRIALRYEYFTMFQSQLLPPALHIAANTSFTPTEAGDLCLEPIEYTTCRMPLLRWCRNIRSQNPIDELRCRVQLPKPSLLGLGRCRLCAAQRLSHHSACEHPVFVKLLQSSLRRTRPLGVSVRKAPPCPSWLASYASLAPSTKRSQHPPRWAKVNCRGWAKPGIFVKFGEELRYLVGIIEGRI